MTPLKTLERAPLNPGERVADAARGLRVFTLDPDAVRRVGATRAFEVDAPELLVADAGTQLRSTLQVAARERRGSA